jgi:hypothetical protein
VNCLVGAEEKSRSNGASPGVARLSGKSFSELSEPNKEKVLDSNSPDRATVDFGLIRTFQGSILRQASLRIDSLATFCDHSVVGFEALRSG